MRRATSSTRIPPVTLMAELGLAGLTALEVGVVSRRLAADRVALLHGVVEAASSIAARYQGEERAGRLEHAELRLFQAFVGRVRQVGGGVVS
jgi:hypothetical protein